MKHRRVTDRIRETAAQHALGALEAHEAQAFEAHLREGCATCAEALQGFERVAERLTGDVTPERPRREVWRRLVERVEADAAVESGERRFDVVRAGEGPWREIQPGVRMKVLEPGGRGGRCTALVRMEAGAHLPRHRHLETEELFVLEGDCHVAPDRVLGAGDYFRAEKGSLHEVTYTERGTTFLSSFWNELA